VLLSTPGFRVRNRRGKSDNRPKQDPCQTKSAHPRDGADLWLNLGFSRRSVPAGFMAPAGAAALGPGATLPARVPSGSNGFPEMARVRDENDHGPEGSSRQVLMQGGDPLFPDCMAFDPANLISASSG
jgi:secreted PhoX family phosphatase